MRANIKHFHNAASNSSGYPHVVAAILAEYPASSLHDLVPLRGICTAFKAAIDVRLFRHVVIDADNNHRVV